LKLSKPIKKSLEKADIPVEVSESDLAIDMG